MAEAKVLIPGGHARRRLHRALPSIAASRSAPTPSPSMAARRTPGPAYLGRAMAKMPAEAIAADLRLMLVKGAAAGIPVIVGSAGTSGTDAGVDWVGSLVEQIAVEEGLTLRRGPHLLASRPKTSCAPPRRRTVDAAGAGPPPDRRAPRPVRPHRRPPRCGAVHRALDAGADVVIAGRATDTAVIAAAALRARVSARTDLARRQDRRVRRAVHDQPSRRRRPGRDRRRRLHRRAAGPDSACTPLSVAAHMIYENANPNIMREPSGTLDVTDAVYEPLDERRVRVDRFTLHAEPYTMKLEGAGLVGFQSLAIAGIREPEILAQIDVWADTLKRVHRGEGAAAHGPRRMTVRDRDPLLRLERRARRPRPRPDAPPRGRCDAARHRRRPGHRHPGREARQPVPAPHAAPAHGAPAELRVHGLARRDRTGPALRVPAQPRRPPGRSPTT